jgi:hypothetical protein
MHTEPRRTMYKIFKIVFVVAMIIIATTACTICSEKISLEFNDINLKEKLTSMEKAINQKDEELLNLITRNPTATNKLLEDFSAGELMIKDISSYILTENIIRVQIELELLDDNEMKEYVILIEKKKEGWEFYPSGFINQ